MDELEQRENYLDTSRKKAVESLLDHLSEPAQTIGKRYDCTQIYNSIVAIDLLAYRELRKEKEKVAYFYQDGRFEVGKFQMTADRMHSRISRMSEVNFQEAEELVSFVYLAAKEEPNLFELVSSEHENNYLKLSPLSVEERTKDVLERWGKT